MTLRSADDLKEWKYCPICSYPLVESKLLAKDAEGFISFQVGCKNNHSFVLANDPRHGEVMLRAWEGVR
jgi:hypothetical protein